MLGRPDVQPTLSANDPGQWQVVARQAAGNTSVRTYPNAQQLMNNWTGDGWGPCGTCSDTPLSALTQLTSTYTEVTPRGGTIAQFAWDIWTNNNTGHPAEIMVWVDNSGRGSGGATQVGTATLAGQDWTIYMYGDGELIWSLGAVGTFAQQGSGTVDLLAILQESVRQGFTSPAATIGQVNAGWGICSTGGVDETFAVSRYTLTMASWAHPAGRGRAPDTETNERPRERIKDWVRTRRFAQVTYNHPEAGEVAIVVGGTAIQLFRAAAPALRGGAGHRGHRRRPVERHHLARRRRDRRARLLRVPARGSQRARH